MSPRWNGINRGWKVIVPTAVVYLLAAVFFNGCSAGRSHLKVGAHPEGEVVEATGYAAQTSDQLGMKRAALEDARKSALEKVIGVLISARTQVEKAITIQQSILAQTAGYVKNYEILEEKLGSDGIYFCKIRALVSLEKVRQDLAAQDLLSSPVVGNPRVLIRVEEAVAGKSGAAPRAFTDSLGDALNQSGYRVVAGNTADAEVVIDGSAKVERLYSTQLEGIISFRGNASVTAKRLQDQSVVASESISASAVDVTESAAAEKALAQLGKQIAAALKDKIAKNLYERAFVTIRIEGTGSLENLNQLKAVLAQLSGIGDVWVRNYSVQESTVETQLKGMALDALVGALSSNTQIAFKVKESRAGFILLSPK